MLQPVYEPFLPSYGYLMWLNRPVHDAHCCAARWGGLKNVCGPDKAKDGCLQCCTAEGANPKNSTDDVFKCAPPAEWKSLATACSEPQVTNLSVAPCFKHGSQWIDKNMIGENVFGPDNLAPAPDDFAVAMGNFAKYLVVIPSLNLTFVTLGQSSGASKECVSCYDDAQTLSLVWDALEPAVAHPHNQTYTAEAESKLEHESKMAPKRKEEKEQAIVESEKRNGLEGGG